MNKLKFLIVVLFVIGAVGAVLYWTMLGWQQSSSSLTARQVTTFEECVQAGYPVGESYPPQCWTPDGKHFVEGAD
jgi:hypothetical protein